MTALFRGFLQLLGLLPLRWAHRLGAASGWLARTLPHSYRRVVEKNLDICLPELRGEARERFCSRAYAEMGKTLWELGVAWTWPSPKLLRKVREVSGESGLKQALTRGKGVILAAPHLGSWEVLGAYLATHYVMTSMYRPSRIPALDNMIRASRQRLGATLVPTNNQGIKQQIQALKRNELVAILPDQDPRNDGNVFAPFFGLQASTPTLLPRLARKTGAAVIFAFAERLPRGEGYHLHFAEAPTEIYADDPLIAATALNRGIEACIRAIPEQYQWTYKRFKTRPPGEAKFY